MGYRVSLFKFQRIPTRIAMFTIELASLQRWNCSTYCSVKQITVNVCLTCSGSWASGYPPYSLKLLKLVVITKNVYTLLLLMKRFMVCVQTSFCRWCCLVPFFFLCRFCLRFFFCPCLTKKLAKPLSVMCRCVLLNRRPQFFIKTVSSAGGRVEIGEVLTCHCSADCI